MTESFLPHMNGVTGSVMQILRHLEREGHAAHILAPDAVGIPQSLHGARVEPVPSLALPGYRNVRVGAATAHRVAASLQRFRPDVVHLASPFALGWRGVLAAGRLGVPAVAAYQTDVAAYTERYGLAATTTFAQNHIVRLHRRATLTLAPSSESEQQLAGLGVDRIRRWGRGVDAERFQPSRRDAGWRRTSAEEVLVGYVGRLAAEKQVEDLRALRGIPGVRLVIIGEGPARARLEAMMPEALFLGHLEGDELATAMASLDVFVHPGESETFGQTLQEAHASGVPIVATGSGGPLDLVRMGIDGWLYRPGDLDDLRMRVADLAGDARKRRAFGEAGRIAVSGRSWSTVCTQLLDHFGEAATLHAVDRSLRSPRTRRPEPAVSYPGRRWNRFVALGDSLTEGLCDPAPDGALRGWADRLALLLAARGGLHYANLAVRSRRVDDVCGEQLRRARELRPDLVSILVGANDLVRSDADVAALADKLEGAVRTLRADGADVLLVTPFLPDRRAAGLFARRFGAFAGALAEIAERTGAMLLDTDLHPSLADRSNWGEDLVHLGSRGHRFLAYRAGEVLDVPHAEALGALDAVLHESESSTRAAWWRDHALPWAWRRMRGRVAGDGRVAKHDDYVYIGRSTSLRQARVS
ncbi:GDSL-type esterase/lipase family protein [Microbacterium sp. M28]|uniref:GDSL-type esterase/lipase family protein n=1 Tax=Microbacterium sp. M28 TaxID=2962064 RepID=UPI0021F47174|nr:GDSL-type esterase/lipase family protein [Microbacterium sp. M28]UYO98347.1 GDSL-type esterase/lipase family protein [Microbacterium sp. M28]